MSFHHQVEAVFLQQDFRCLASEGELQVLKEKAAESLYDFFYGAWP